LTNLEQPLALALRGDNVLATKIDAPSPREQVLVRYRELREISLQLHHKILGCVSGDAFMNQARRLGLAQGKRTLILDDIDELNYVNDLVIYTASAGRSRAIDRYARSAGLAAGSDEALVLEAMRAARSRFSSLSGAMMRRDWSPSIRSAAIRFGLSIWASKRPCPGAQ
jgi:hypothetical protein